MFAFFTLQELETSEKLLEARAKDPQTPQGEVKEIQRRLRECRNQIQREKVSAFADKSGIHVSGSDDYIGASGSPYSFYYGYEETHCPLKSHQNGTLCEEKDCEKEEWCFVARKGDEEIARYCASELTVQYREVEYMLILGMSKFIKEHLK